MPDHAGRGARAGAIARSGVVLMAVTMAIAAPVRAQVSPGPLARAHAALDGNLACVKCHGKGEGEMDRRCLACHEEIATLVKEGRGFHAREGKKDCARCHPDHGGRDFALIAWPDGAPETFDHARAGWPLKERHAAVACAKCHAAANVKGAMVGMVKVKRDMVWAGLDSNCRACHEDIHRGALGEDCTKCHSEKGWRPAANFDHARTAFALTGLHTGVPCAKCHEAAGLKLVRDAKGRVIPLYKPLPHDECSACHADAHRGSFGPRCADCHMTAGFKMIAKGRFDHSRTRYPLRGRHAAVACDACHHEKTAWGKKPPFGTCDGCHRDPHAGQTVTAGKATDCDDCHTVDGFKPSTFTAERHAKTPFPLQGGHARASCMGCHGRAPAGTPAQTAAAVGSANVWMRPAHGRCVDCHRDPHEGRFAAGGARARSGDCLACHSTDSFRPSTYDVAAHDTARFRLRGAHRATPCVACHRELEFVAKTTAQAAAATATLPMRNDARDCRDCHATPHGIQFDSRKDGGACEACHGEDRFVPASGFDHARVKSFPLDGRHRNVPCAKCHPVATTSEGRKMTLYRPLSARCESCHAEGDPLLDRG